MLELFLVRLKPDATPVRLKADFTDLSG